MSVGVSMSWYKPEQEKYTIIYIESLNNESYGKDFTVYARDIDEAVDRFREKTGKGIEDIHELKKYSSDLNDLSFNLISKGISDKRKKWIIKRQKVADDTIREIKEKGYVETQIGYMIGPNRIVVGDKIYKSRRAGYYDMLDWIYRLRNLERCKTPPMMELHEEEYQKIARSEKGLQILGEVNPVMAITMGLTI